MAGGDWLRDEATKYFFTGNSMGTRPTGWEVALFTDSTTEVSGTNDANYARQSVTFTELGDVGRAENDAIISFPSAESGASYTITHWAIYDTNGNQLIVEPLEFNRDVAGGDVISFAAGDLTVGFGG